jgi:hypothetical protein
MRFAGICPLDRESHGKNFETSPQMTGQRLRYLATRTCDIQLRKLTETATI